MLAQIVANRVYDFSHQVGGREIQGDVAVAVGPGDDFYLVVRNLPQMVVRLTIGTVPGDEEIVGQFGSKGDGDGEFVWPTGIGVGRDYNLYVTDEWLNRVTVFDRDGNYLRHWGDTGDAAGQLNGPSGIDVDSHGDLYIVDSLSHRVQKFTSDGGYITEWSTGTVDNTQGITVDALNNVYVTDTAFGQVVKYASGG